MKRILLVLAIVAAISLGAAQLNAQGVVTIEDVVEKLRLLTREVEVQNAYADTLATRIVDVENRLEMLENPPTATPMITITPVRPTVIPTATATPIPAVTVPRYELEDIFDEYGANEARAEAKYLHKVIEVNGVILDIEKKGGGFFSGKERYEITLEGRGFLSHLDCSLPLSSEEEVLQLNAGESVTLRGELYFGSSTIINMRDCEIIEE